MSLNVVRLSQIAEINPPFRETLPAHSDVAFVPMSAVSAESGDTPAVEVRPLDEVKKGYTPLLHGDLLIAKITPCFENGKIAQARLPQRVGFGSTEFHVVRPKAEVVDPRYLLHFLRREEVRQAGEKRMTGSGGQKRVPVNFVTELKIPLPQLEAQRRIADTLDRAEALRCKRREALAKLEELPEAIFHEMFGMSGQPDAPTEMKTLSELVRPGDHINYGVVQPGPEVEDGVPLVRVSDLVDARVGHQNLRKVSREVDAKHARSRLRGDELLMSCVGTTGVLALATERERGFNVARAVARIPLNGAVDRTFVLYSLKGPRVQQWINRELRTVAQPTLNIREIEAIRIPVPALEQQREFAVRIEAIDKLKIQYKAHLEKLDELFASLQHRAFQGVL